MQPNDIAHLNNSLQRLYGERYAGLTTDMGLLWYKHLKSFSLAMAEQAVERWAVTHLLHQIPTMMDLATLAEDLQREQRQEAYRQATPALPSADADALLDARDDLLSPDELKAYLDTIYAHCDDQDVRLAKAEASVGINPPDPQRWLPLTEDCSPESRQWAPRTGSQGLTPLLPQPTEEA